MKKIKFEEMVPAELLEARLEASLAYLPVGSMEWHGPHMGMGMDTINAYHVALETAKRTGGVVLPPLYIGTEAPRSPEALRRVGFTGSEAVVGMDFPSNSVKSMYWPEELFEAILRQQLKMLCAMGYGLIAVINGHGADNQLAVLKRLATEFNRRGGTRVLPILALFEDCGVGIGHAGLAETAIMQALCPQGVQLSRLPPQPQRLPNTDYAIVDSETFSSGPNADYTVRFDPRDATPELGQRLLGHAVEKCVELVSRAYQSTEADESGCCAASGRA